MIYKCDYCKKQYLTTPSRLGKRIVHFCSRVCFHSFVRENGLSRIFTGKCEVCGKSFTRPKSRFSDGRGKYCSHKCKYIGKTTTNIPNRKCIVCGNGFHAMPSQIKKGWANYCSRKCFAINHTGENGSNWKGGITPESKRARKTYEYKVWRNTVFERDNYTCQFCGVKGGKLQADHIKPFSHFPELRLDLSNGRTLCVDCHKKTPTYAGAAKARRGVSMGKVEIRNSEKINSRYGYSNKISD